MIHGASRALALGMRGVVMRGVVMRGVVMRGVVMRGVVMRAVGTLAVVAQLAVVMLAAACATAAPPPATTSATQSASPLASQAGTEPPSAFLAINGSGRHEGELGTYVYRGAGSDAPWLPARALDAVAIGTGDRLTVSLRDQGLIGPWAATIAPAGDDRAEQARAFGRDETVGGLRETIELPAPPAGSWVVMVNLEYGDGTGSGAYFWLLDVR